MRTVSLFSILLLCLCSCNQWSDGLNEKEFSAKWTVESESPDYSVSFVDGACEIVSPKGLTLWYNEKLSGDVTIEYDAIVYDSVQENFLARVNRGEQTPYYYTRWIGGEDYMSPQNGNIYEQGNNIYEWNDGSLEAIQLPSVSGTALCKRYKVSGNVNNLANGAFSFQGCGPLE